MVRLEAQILHGSLAAAGAFFVSVLEGKTFNDCVRCSAA